MIRVIIRNKKCGPEVNWDRDFNNRSEADAWIEANAHLFGQPERWIESGQESQDDEILETKEVDGSLGEGNKTLYRVSADFTVSFEDISEEHKQALIAEYTQGRDKECDLAVKALLAPSEDVTHIMFALYDFFVVMNIDGTSTQQDIDASKASLTGMKNLMGQIQMLRATRDADVQAYIDSL